MKAVTFCGHIELQNVDTAELKIKLYNTIKHFIGQGAKVFLFGEHRAFDILCAHTVQKLKEEYPEILSVIVLPNTNREYDTNLYDCAVYPPLENNPTKFSISAQKQYLADNSDVVIAYVCHNLDDAAKALDYANKKGRIVVNLAF